eukprot:jgi/Botrbrau1/11311/Bobra.0038s0072.1
MTGEDGRTCNYFWGVTTPRGAGKGSQLPSTLGRLGTLNKPCKGAHRQGSWLRLTWPCVGEGSSGS